ncbi:MAG: MBOAT family protein [Planctomycetota bacterium]|nr:MBOAT family protein [Planctomycetota bacterium]
MIFPSYIFFLIFLPAVLVIWHSYRNRAARLIFLTVASYLFYGWWDYRFTALLLFSSVVDYVAGNRIYANDAASTRRRWLLVSMVANLGVLAYFKYYDFFVTSAVSALTWLGVETSVTLLNVVLPVGISFYTFQSMSYTIDIYRRTARPANDFLHLAAYVAMFPQLVAGPIVRYSLLEKQLRSAPASRASPEQVAEGVWLFSLGIAKKVWVADRVAPFANELFDSGGAVDAVTAWIGVLAYSMQLYYDFSGYSDMARGLGKMLGFEFPVNFNSPYKSADISEFWNRWHITLSNWLRDYLFIPLGGSRGGFRKTLRNLVMTMFLGGLWHGAGWTFILWGLFHGALLVLNALWKKVGRRMPAVAAISLTFVCVQLGWVLFRAPSLVRALEIYQGLFGSSGIGSFQRYFDASFVAPSVMLVAATIISFAAPNSQQLQMPKNVLVAGALAVFLLVTMTKFMEETPFLYFSF